MVTFDVLSSGFPLLVESLMEGFGPEVPIHLMFGVTVVFTLLAGVLLIGYSSSFTRETASRIHNESALALWYGIVAWVATFVAFIALSVVVPPLAAFLLFVVQMVGYAVAAIALGLFVLRGPLEDDSDESEDEIDDDAFTTPSGGGFGGIVGGEASPWLALAVGTIPIALLVIIPLLGQILTILIAGFGIGALAIEYLEYEESTPSPTEG
ncbi:hypothetical protein ACYJ1Y_06925 [Natrialbaceae archaeon A-gly3]